MGKWEPILWIFGGGVGFCIFVFLVESLKGFKKKKS
jgi:hypothetical protein